MKNSETNGTQNHIRNIRLSDIDFVRNKVRLPKGKYKYVYPYIMPDGSIKYQSYISEYKWSAYHETEKAAAIAVDKYLIGKGLKPINILVAVEHFH